MIERPAAQRPIGRRQPVRPSAWREYQRRAAGLLEQMGFATEIETAVEGARAVHKVDVAARTTLGGVDVLWIVECKYWNRAVPKEHVLTLAQIAQDIGADRAILLSAKGFQAGAISAARQTNILLTGLEELNDAAADSISELKIRRALARIKALEPAQQDISLNFDLPEAGNDEEKADRATEPLCACLEASMAATAVFAGRFPVRLPSPPWGSGRESSDLAVIAAALTDAADLFEVRHWERRLALAEEFAPNVAAATSLIQLAELQLGLIDRAFSPGGATLHDVLVAELTAGIVPVFDLADEVVTARDPELRRSVRDLITALADHLYNPVGNGLKREDWPAARRKIIARLKLLNDAADLWRPVPTRSDIEERAV